mgnify:CR=1 FL=1
MSFDKQPFLTSESLTLRPLADLDHAGLFAAAQDPLTWAGHHAPDRYKPEAFAAYFAALLKSGSTLTIIDNATAKIIGCSAYYTAPDRPDTISIGFTFLERRYWGGKTNLTIKTLMLEHAFASFADVWFHIGPNNLRSQNATLKLGAKFVEDVTLNLGGSPAPWKVYKLTNTDWRQRATLSS